MQVRHWIALVSLGAAAATLLARQTGNLAVPGTKSWLWDGLYWALLLVAVITLLRGRRRARRSSPRAVPK
jgi:hypothetical protein